MKTRLSLILPLLLSLAACSGAQAPPPAAQDTAAPVETQDAAPAAQADADTAPEATDAAEAGAGEAGEAAPLAPRPPSGPAPVAGVDYVEIANGQPFQPAAGKIEVAEVFGYTCPHCAQFEPVLNAWKRRQPADVEVIAVPAAFGGFWTPYARAFYTAEALGVLAQSHDAMFAAIHLQRSLPVNPNVGAEQLAPFYARYGVDAKRFADTFNSFGVDAKINRARQFASKSKIEGTPSLVVAGKYTITVDQQGFDKMLNTAEWLIAQERGGTR
ncbi:disulfide bond formation protein DsbA [Pseudoxanthomonas broegbernensis]|uniref:Disulfide bond formation protein DsbA n=1 Tax=Pseudoxanthomonas broegbernensis TaxID=83619 RepID=A0A7V8GNN2_9GAMM|nr:thiol:disulfide interchange protein DsbA/DsbL [Pseudoxanthomonas broegbernensis]KAF1687141.1 disulfide bond formation protein DsbA [Pseudoxanthomonas broegbernensis]MBB6065882.1 thiol:disulfide interchange protein DsbA [Pseudoxanthomonas broegbernensis]